MSTKEAQQGPYKDVITTTIDISPIKITTTKSRESTHVPPTDCGCGGGGGIGELLANIGEMVSSGGLADVIKNAATGGEGNPGGFPGEGNPEG